LTKKNFALFRAEEFIEAITQHIPDKSFQLVRYHGWYSNRMLISYITEAPVIWAILEHLHLWRDIPQPRSPPVYPELAAQQDAGHHRYEHADDGWPGCEEPFITYDLCRTG